MDVNLKLMPHQLKLMRSGARKSLLLCGRGAGKSYICAVMALLALLQGHTVMLGGQRFDTLHDTLYAEIKRIAHEWGVYDRIEWKESPMMMTMGEAHVFFATYASPDMARGYSRVQLMILDELFLAPVDLLSIWTPVMRNAGGPTRIIGATTPRPGSLWNIMMSAPECDWEIIRATSMDNTLISKDELDLILSTIDNDAQYRSEILGEIITDLGNTGIIRLNEFPLIPGESSDRRVIAGLDCGEGVERDCTAFFKRRGNVVLEAWELPGINHEDTVRKIQESHRKVPIDILNMDMAFSDYEYNILKYHFGCEQIHFSRSPSEECKQKYANVRAEMFFNLAWHIKHGLCVEGLDLTAKLKRQLCAIGWFKNPSGLLLLTKKEDLRIALKCSPDIADAAALTCLDRYTGDEPVIKGNEEVDDEYHDLLREIMRDE